MTTISATRSTLRRISAIQHSTWRNTLPSVSAASGSMATTSSTRKMHTGWSSLHEASVFPQSDTTSTIRDEGYDASSYGYRVVISTPRRHSSTMTTSSRVFDFDDYDEYNPLHHNCTPASLDILSSPEVLKILQTPMEEQEESTHSTAKGDRYHSDFEEMEDEWIQSCPSVTSDLSIPAMEEKEM